MDPGVRHQHDLEDFLSRSAAALKAEYSRIRARASEDPGTAGDEGEENWRELLESWLPSDLNVTTKGRIIGANGQLSRQVDVVVLQPGYPRALANRKLYLAGGVLAAFECKLTLKPGHVATAARNARLIRRLAADRVGSPYVEAHSPIIFRSRCRLHRGSRLLERLDSAHPPNRTVNRLASDSRALQSSRGGWIHGDVHPIRTRWHSRADGRDLVGID